MCHAIIRNDRGSIISKLLVCAVIAGILYGVYYYFQATPRFALMQFKRAIVFSEADVGERYMDIDRVIDDLPEKITRGADKETLKKRLIAEIDAPYAKTIFASVGKWSTLTVPIDISGDTATVEQDDGTIIKLEQTSEGPWVITSIRFQPEETDK